MECLVREVLVFGEIYISLSAPAQLNVTSTVKIYLSTATGTNA